MDISCKQQNFFLYIRDSGGLSFIYQVIRYDQFFISGDILHHMLVSLYIRNVLLIEELHIDFLEGFSVILGETGAGKSMLINCLSIVLGDRARRDMIRSGADKAIIVVSFNMQRNPAVLLMLQEYDISHTALLIIRKVILRDESSRIYVNDIPVNISFVARLTEHIMEINSQFSQSRVARVSEHGKMLDEYGGLWPNLLLLREKYTAYHAAQQRLTESRDGMEQAKRDYEYYGRVIKDMEHLSLTADTELELLEQKKKIASSAKLLEALNLIREDLTRGKVISLLNGADNTINRIVGTAHAQEPVVLKIVQHIHDAHSAVQEVLALLDDQLDTLHSDAQALDLIDGKLFELRTLVRKYDTAAEKLPELLQIARDKIALAEHSQQFMENYEWQMKQAREAYLELAMSISQQRHLTAKQMSDAVLYELRDLKMDNINFLVNIDTNTEKFSEHGIDDISFYVAMNAGSKSMPLHKVASGGELSRFMLALRIVLSRVKNLSTIVFDEIDSGVSGEVANAIADKMRVLSNSVQVIAVTHSHQVASRGDRHFKVQKYIKDGMSSTGVVTLHGPEIVSEIARMISGNHLDSASIMAAQSLLVVQEKH